MLMNRLKWLAALPSAAGVSQQGKAMLVMFFVRNDYTVDQIVGLEEQELTREIMFALQCDDSVATNAARVMTDFLGDLVKIADSPPSTAELRKFILDRQLQMQPKANMMDIYEFLTSDIPTYLSFTVDPLTGKIFNPVWLQLAIEQLYGLPPKM